MLSAFAALERLSTFSPNFAGSPIFYPLILDGTLAAKRARRAATSDQLTAPAS
ncbi:MAG TPA: hypothetical protein VN493_27685 [Thermoanaerobaculia bacterium]|nr:hypothetical protein [Thermoanaerobaculia bacterium]